MSERIEIIGDATLYLGDCREILPTLGKVDAVVTDPPYPNGEGYFLDGIDAAEWAINKARSDVVLAFWSEVGDPLCLRPMVARHIWHRTNVNGKIYEPILHYSADGVKRRSEIRSQPAVFFGAGPGCVEFEGHPTQKPVDLMRWLIGKVVPGASILDPFMGSGTTGVACMNLGRRFIGIEIHEPYFDIACRRIEQAWKQPRLFEEPTPKPVQEVFAL